MFANPVVRKAFEPTLPYVAKMASLSEDFGEELEDFEEEEVCEDDGSEAEYVLVMPVADSGCYLYVCAECGCNLTEIPYYNRFYCENCGLHY